MGMEFNLLGKKKEYPDGFDKISVELGNYIAKANDSFNNFIGLYQSNKNLNEVIYYMQGQASGIIGEMSQRAVLILTGSGVNISFEDFFSKYQNTMQFDYNMHIAMTLNAQAQVMNAFSQRQMMKGQPANPNQLDGEARSSLSALYKDERTKMMLSEAIRTCIINIYNTVLYALVENNI